MSRVFFNSVRVAMARTFRHPRLLTLLVRRPNRHYRASRDHGRRRGRQRGLYSNQSTIHVITMFLMAEIPKPVHRMMSQLGRVNRNLLHFYSLAFPINCFSFYVSTFNYGDSRAFLVDHFTLLSFLPDFPRNLFATRTLAFRL